MKRVPLTVTLLMQHLETPDDRHLQLHSIQYFQLCLQHHKSNQTLSLNQLHMPPDLELLMGKETEQAKG